MEEKRQEPDLPQYFYKYLRFEDPYTRILTESTLKFSHPTEFNDPFDCSPVYNLPSDSRSYGASSYYGKYTRSIHKIPPAKWIQNKNKIKKRFERAATSRELADLMASMGIFCLTTDPLNILMWSHYAYYHRGFVVEFDLDPNIKNKDFGRPFKVDYSKQRPAIEFSLQKDSNDEIHEQFKKIYLVKSDHWKYEEEYRCMVPKRPAQLVSYDQRNVLCSVIAGAKMQEKERNELKAIIRKRSEVLNSDIGFYQAELCDSTFSIKVPGHPRCK